MDIPDDEYVGAEEFLNIAHDSAIAKFLRKQLIELTKGKENEILAEMANEVLRGRIGLREALQVRAYDEELSANFDKFLAHWNNMSSQERKDAEQQGNEFLRELREES